MKLWFSLLALSLSTSVFSQTIETKENEEKFSNGPHNAVVTTIYGNSGSDMMKAWKKKLKQYKIESVKATKNELFADNVLIKEWGTGLVDFYTVLEENKKDNTVRMSVAAKMGDAYLSSSLDKWKYYDLEKMVKDFALENTKKPIEEELEALNKAFVKVQKKQIGIEKEKTELVEEIEKYKRKIGNAENEIVPKEADREKKIAEVAAQKKVIEVSGAAVSEQIAASQKIYDKLVKQQDQLIKEIKNLKEDIEDNKNKIAKNEKKIAKNDEKHAELAEQLKLSKDKITRAKERLSAIY